MKGKLKERVLARGDTIQSVILLTTWAPFSLHSYQWRL